MRSRTVVVTTLILVLLVSGQALGQHTADEPYLRTPWAWHDNPDLSTRPLGYPADTFSVQYTLGTFKPDEYLFPAATFPIDLDANGEAYINSNFGYRYLNGTYDEHFGVDLETGTGDPIYAINGGTVTVADSDNCGAAGRWVEIKHSGGWYSRYFHLQTVGVVDGEVVSAGEQIGTSGGSGFCEDSYYGDHLHLEIRHLNSSTMIPYDPIAFFTTYSTYRWDVYQDNDGKPYIPTQQNGDQGIWTYLVQDSLVWHGYSLSVDGIFGSQTENVVEQFQSDQGITVDGIVGPETWAYDMGKMNK